MNRDAIQEGFTYYASEGEGDPLIFIHGVGLDHTMWTQQLKYFSPYYKVYSYDMLGHGKSAKPLKSAYTIDDFTKQLNEFMQRRQIESAHLVGFSMGGMVGQAFSISFPEKVKTLVIANAVANRTAKERKAVMQRVSIVEREGKNATIEAAIERWFNPSYKASHPDVVTKVEECLRANDEKAYLNAYRVFATADASLWEQLDQIDIPVLVITGEHDQGSNPRMAKQMHEKFTDSELCIVPNVRHMLPVEKADVFNRYIYGFLNQYKEVKNNGVINEV